VDCGACEPVCPVGAIYYEDDVPEEWKPFIDANAQVFAGISVAGGASKVGRLPHDAPLISAFPDKGRVALTSRPTGTRRYTSAAPRVAPAPTADWAPTRSFCGGKSPTSCRLEGRFDGR
jgi:ferredoxin